MFKQVDFEMAFLCSKHRRTEKMWEGTDGEFVLVKDREVIFIERLHCSDSQREYALYFSALHQCSFNWWSSQLKGQCTLCSKFLLEWKSWQGKTCTKDIVLLKFVQSDSCQISLKQNWKGKTNFLWGQSSAHLLFLTCLIFFPVKEILTKSIWKL